MAIQYSGVVGAGGNERSRAYLRWRARAGWAGEFAGGHQLLLERPAHLQSGYVSYLCAVAAGVGAGYAAIPAIAAHCLVGARGDRGAFHAASLSSATRHETLAADGSCVRHALGRGWSDGVDRGAGEWRCV